MKITERTFGVEIEMSTVNREALREKFQEAGIAIIFPGYTHQRMRVWKLVPGGRRAL